MTKWRVGRKVDLNVYEDDRPVCQCHSAEDAHRIVAAMNFWEEFWQNRKEQLAGTVNSDLPSQQIAGKVEE